VPYLFDVSSAFDGLGMSVYTDPVHVEQVAKNVMGEKIGEIVAEELQRAGHAIEQ